MADLYSPSQHYSQSSSATNNPSARDPHHQSHQPSYPPSSNSLVYGIPPSNGAAHSPLDDDDAKHSASSDPPKMESKPQATFLTKLYALLERPEYQSMIRWDANGEQIIVERPEQLALHVLPSIYRQSRFASFSRQLNIYGFMRKVNLRNVDPAIDDPDASTWSHPTLTRNSPPEVVANFKRRVPPRLPKQRKRSDAGAPGGPNELPRLDIPPHQALPPHHHVPSHHPPSQQLGGGIGLPTLPMSMSDLGKPRPRGLSAPGPYGMQALGGGMTPIQTPQSATFPSSSSKWGGSMSGASSGYSRTPLPPLSIPGGGNGYGGPPSAYSQSQSSMMSALSPHDDGSYGSSSGHNSGYSAGSHSSIPGLRDSGSSVFAYNNSPSYGGHSETSSSGGQHWNSGYGLPPALPPPSALTNSSPTHGGSSLSSILNHSGGSNYSHQQPPQRPTLNTSSSFPNSAYQHPSQPSTSSLSPDSRPTTGYSVASAHPYDMDSAATSAGPDSSRPITPASMRPSSGKSLGPSASQLNLRHGRPRRRSEAVASGPYPSPYYDGQGHGGISTDLRPVTAPASDSASGLKLPSVDSYHFSSSQNPSPGEFAYSPTGHEHNTDPWSRSLRPSTSTSSISAASTSMIHTPPILEDQEGESNGSGPGRAHSISTPSSGADGLDGDIARFLNPSQTQQPAQTSSPTH